MLALITRVTAVRPLGDNLTVVSIEGSDNVIVANRHSNGNFRWMTGEPVVYVAENMIVPDDVLQERGYWDTEKSRGLLEGKRGNRVKMRRFGPEDDRVESRGLLFKTLQGNIAPVDDDLAINSVYHVQRGEEYLGARMGQDVGEFLGLTPHTN